MKDDVSEVPLTGCTVITGSSSLTNYSNNIRKDYIFNGGKWYLYRTQTNYNNYDVSSYNCINPTSLESYNIYKPLLFGVALLLFICFFVLIYKVVKGFFYVR